MKTRLILIYQGQRGVSKWQGQSAEIAPAFLLGALCYSMEEGEAGHPLLLISASFRCTKIVAKGKFYSE